jgi:DNA mismatch repair protein MutH
MKQKLLLITLALTALGTAGTASARGWGHVHVHLAAPAVVRHGPVYAPVVAIAPVRVASTCAWVEGHWRWNGFEETWIPGHCAHRAAYLAPAVSHAPAPVSVSLGFSGRF